MVFDIVFSDRASFELTSTLEYIEHEWSLRISNEFTKTFNEKINIRTNPYLYTSFKNKKQVRKCVVNKQISIFYRIKKEEVQIITLFDNRKNPKKLKL
jgi:plasmid stabilization system protein ParE